MILPFNTFTLHSLIGFMVTISLAVMFYVVYLKAGRRFIDLLSANFILVVALVCLFYFLMDNLVPAGMSARGWAEGPTEQALRSTTLALNRWAWVMGMFLIPTQLHFVLHYCRTRNFIRRRIWAIYAAVAVAAPAVVFTDLFGVAPETPLAETSGWLVTIPWLPGPGPAAALPTVCALVLQVYGLSLLWKTRRDSVADSAESLGARRIVFFAFVAQMAASCADAANGALGLPVPAATPLGSAIMGTLLAIALVKARVGADKARFQLAREKASLLECVPQPLLYFSDDLTIHWSNPAAAAFAGGGLGQLEGTRINEIWSADCQEVEAVKAALTTGRSVEQEVTREDDSTWIVYASAVVDNKDQPVGAILLAMDITDIRQAQKALRESNIKILSAREDERRRVAQDLHDSVAQGLTALQMHLRACAGKSQAQTGQGEQFVQAADRAANLGKEVRSISHDLYPPALDLLGLASAIEDVLEQYRKGGVECTFDCPEDLRKRRFGQAAEVALYRTIQEAMNNANRHGHAKAATIRMRQTDEGLRVTVTDDGVGFDVEKCKQGLGTSSMKGRIEGIGGELVITSRPGETCVEVTVSAEMLAEHAPEPAEQTA